MKIILGSASARRKELLEEAGYVFDIITADIDEKAIRHTDPDVLTRLLAHAKADALVKAVDSDALLITSDTVGSWQNTIVEKPESEDHARELLKQYHKSPVHIVTSVVVTNTETAERGEVTEQAELVFKEIPETVIEAWIATDKVMHYAGGFAYQAPEIAEYITTEPGKRDVILGLPLKATKQLLEQLS